jgi:hypothetical protein
MAPKCHVFTEIKSLMIKTGGLAEVLQLVFMVEESPEGYTARALGESIFTG